MVLVITLMLHTARYRMTLPHSPDEVFAFFADAGNLEKITPNELRFRIVSPTPVSMGKDALIDYKLRLYGIPFKWQARISAWHPPLTFIDEQVTGPFRQWIHTHRFSVLNGKTRIDDEVRYILPFSPFGEIAYPLIRSLIDRIFGYRQRQIRRIFQGKLSDVAISPTD